MTGLDYLVWDVCVDADVSPLGDDVCEWYGHEAGREAAGDHEPPFYIIQDCRLRRVKGRRGFMVTYFSPEDDEALIVAENVATVAEGRAVAQRHYRVMAIRGRGMTIRR